MILPDPFPAASAAARKHAEIEWPRESVGFVIEGGEYVPLINVHPDPENHFAISEEDEQKYGPEKIAVIHSHCLRTGEFFATDGPLAAGPSEHDMRQQLASACIWGIVNVVDSLSHESVIYFGDEVGPPLPLVGRPFIHGVYDCYSLIRDFYRTNYEDIISDYHGVRSIMLPEQPRDFGWWDDRAGDGTAIVPRNLYVENFRAAGFRQIALEEMRPGDVFLAQIRSPVTNHGGVYLGNGLILHHLRSRLSKTDVAGRWLTYVTHCLRYEGPKEPVEGS